MPKIDGSYVDNDFGKKIDHLAGIIGYRHEPMMFRSNYLARIFGTNDASMRRKRIGKEAVHFRELSVLIKIFDLGDVFDYTVFLLEMPKFKDALRTAGVGTYGLKAGSHGRKTLLALAQKRSPRCALQIVRTSNGHAHGLGLRSLGKPARDVVCAYDDEVILTATVPGPGHLLVVSDNLSAITCLMPSVLAPSSTVDTKEIRIPTSDEYPTIVVTGDPGRYRLFAVWTRNPIYIPGQPQNDIQRSSPWTIPGYWIDSIAKGLQALPQEERAVATATYRITH
ncbi:MAG: hypothetical protein K2Y42_10330 [Hyphomicrobium sp.]|jgi:hypothetical protein|uniref:hypothetical protein n=1 Tax=Hyphomicrobium sp. TaxID=82 RepID=UPI0025B99C03|nr:hypothetical protein [Hyphomicrobium sp.]MBX9863136.1 hypothetical protein [Hyphomicrobium sp.]